ncbi:MAG: hypothetical protein V4792_11295 [Pseudomonadota bacterium]
MRSSFLLLALSVVGGGSSLSFAATEPSVLAAAASACQRAAEGTLRDTRGSTTTANFNAAPVVVPGAADAGELTLRGAGQARSPSASRPFSYSCNFDTRSGTVAGVVLRDLGTPEPSAITRPGEPDLSRISPAACESAAAGALKRRWPGVAGISFNGETRQLSQQAGDRANLRGQGTATPSVRDPATHFSYDCDIDPRSGRIVAVRIAD